MLFAPPERRWTVVGGEAGRTDVTTTGCLCLLSLYVRSCRSKKTALHGPRLTDQKTRHFLSRQIKRRMLSEAFLFPSHLLWCTPSPLRRTDTLRCRCMHIHMHISVYVLCRSNCSFVGSRIGVFCVDLFVSCCQRRPRANWLSPANAFPFFASTDTWGYGQL